VECRGYPRSGQGLLQSIRRLIVLIKLQHYATRELVFDELPPLLIYFLAHVMELFLVLRYYMLLPFTLVFGRTLPRLIPRWLGPAVFLQPSALDGQLNDLIIDDSRARKMLGWVRFHFLHHKYSLAHGA
jgi:hypothetical protein